MAGVDVAFRLAYNAVNVVVTQLNALSEASALAAELGREWSFLASQVLPRANGLIGANAMEPLKELRLLAVTTNNFAEDFMRQRLAWRVLHAIAVRNQWTRLAAEVKRARTDLMDIVTLDAAFYVQQLGLIPLEARMHAAKLMDLERDLDSMQQLDPAIAARDAASAAADVGDEAPDALLDCCNATALFSGLAALLYNNGSPSLKQAAGELMTAILEEAADDARAEEAETHLGPIELTLAGLRDSATRMLEHESEAVDLPNNNLHGWNASRLLGLTLLQLIVKCGEHGIVLGANPQLEECVDALLAWKSAQQGATQDPVVPLDLFGWTDEQLMGLTVRQLRAECARRGIVLRSDKPQKLTCLRALREWRAQATATQDVPAPEPGPPEPNAIPGPVVPFNLNGWTDEQLFGLAAIQLRAECTRRGIALPSTAPHRRTCVRMLREWQHAQLEA
ncbi:hypothetical protein T492DRAFT_920756 [Pavlovales sp. CCMP2436]|nr:hypothetical protein T492DRAFT_920756 [Pavlovales sp. CCMP2436]|mmetsp:Transcript_277/g.698  ORF Transcript_277/g.698 Transcript_277/m.698 type:complete len:451 (+) Transcript_277:65-1417(+)